MILKAFSKLAESMKSLELSSPSGKHFSEKQP